MTRIVLRLLPSLLILASFSQAQQTTGVETVNAVPSQVKFIGKLLDQNGTPLTTITGVTFALYKDQEGGAPLWVETQNVQPDKLGRYSVMLGSAANQGLPADLFVAGEPRWVGVKPHAQPEQPRVMLASVPYAMKAGDATTVGGLPPSAFVRAVPLQSASSNQVATSQLDPISPPISGTGSTNYLAIWTNKTTLGSSVLFQSGMGNSAKIGINTATPGSTLDVNGGAIIRGLFKLPAAGTATAASGKNSQPEDFIVSSFSSTTHVAVNQTFRWQAEPAGNNTSSPSGTLNLLFGSGASNPSETGLKLSSAGIFTFASGQTFPGTITGITAGTDLTGGGNTGNVTLGLDTTKVPQLATPNIFTANQTINSSVSVAGSVSGGSGSFSGNVTSGASINASGSVSGSSAGFTGTGFPVVDVQQTGSGGEAILATSSGVVAGQAAIDGEANGLSGSTVGVLGNNVSASNFATGVLGQNFSNSGITLGVEGISNSSINGPRGVGVFGVNTSQSNTAGLFLGNNPVGVWGDTGSFGIGVQATADQGYALAATNNSPTGSYTGTFDNLQSSTHNLYVLVAEGAFGFCAEDTDGNLGCTGSKSAIVPVDEGRRQIALYAVEAPQNWFEDFGSGQLSNGSATIALDSALPKPSTPRLSTMSS